MNDPKPMVRAAAIVILGNYKKAEYKPLFMKSLTDSSYTVAGNALDALAKIDNAATINQVRLLSAQPAKGALMDALIRNSSESSLDSIAAKFDKLPLGNAKFNMLQPFADFLGNIKNTDQLKKGVDIIVKFRDTIPQSFRSNIDSFINGVINSIAEKKQKAGLTEQADYIKSKIPADMPQKQ